MNNKIVFAGLGIVAGATAIYFGSQLLTKQSVSVAEPQKQEQAIVSFLDGQVNANIKVSSSVSSTSDLKTNTKPNEKCDELKSSDGTVKFTICGQDDMFNQSYYSCGKVSYILGDKSPQKLFCPAEFNIVAIDENGLQLIQDRFMNGRDSNVPTISIKDLTPVAAKLGNFNLETYFKSINSDKINAGSYEDAVKANGQEGIVFGCYDYAFGAGYGENVTSLSYSCYYESTAARTSLYSTFENNGKPSVYQVIDRVTGQSDQQAEQDYHNAKWSMLGVD
jgi:hypothetical protein